MSFPSEAEDETQYYPYHIIYSHEKLPFRSKEERQIANMGMDEFIKIIEREKAKSE